MEPWLQEAAAGARFQFERQGYFMKDATHAQSDRPVFVRVVELRDGWSKKQTTMERAQPKSQTKKPPQPEAPVQIAERSGALTERMEQLQKRYGLPPQDAERLTRDEGTDAYFQSGIDAGAPPRSLASLTLNDLPTATRPPIQHLVELLAMEAAGTLKRNQRTAVLEAMLTAGCGPQAAGKALGLTDQAGLDLDALIAEVVSQHPAERERYQGGDKQLFGFFMGACMRAAKGGADPKTLKSQLRQTLDG